MESSKRVPATSPAWFGYGLGGKLDLANLGREGEGVKVKDKRTSEQATTRDGSQGRAHNARIGPNGVVGKWPPRVRPLGESVEAAQRADNSFWLTALDWLPDDDAAACSFFLLWLVDGVA